MTNFVELSNTSIILATEDTSLELSPWKASCRVATVSNVVLQGLQTIDNLSINVSDRILVKDQTDGKFNGIYVVSSTSWERASDANTSAKIKNSSTIINEGTVNGGQIFALITTDPVLDFTALVYATIAGGNGITALNSLVISPQYLGIGLTGSSPNWGSVGNTHTLNLPYADYLTSGIISTTSQRFNGDKTIYIRDTLDNTINQTLFLTHDTNVTPVAGFGSSLVFKNKIGLTSLFDYATIDAKLLNPVAIEAETTLNFNVYHNSTSNEILVLSKKGVQVNNVMFKHKTDGDIPTPDSGKVSLYIDSNNVLYIKDDTGVSTNVGTGITNLNGLTTLTQFFQTGRVGSTFNISNTDGNKHIFNIPFAGIGVEGDVKIGDQIFDGKKTIYVADSLNSSITPVFNVYHHSLTTGANGVGVALDLSTDDFKNNPQSICSLRAKYTDIITEDTQLDMFIFNGGSFESKAFISKYGLGCSSHQFVETSPLNILTPPPGSQIMFISEQDNRYKTKDSTGAITDLLTSGTPGTGITSINGVGDTIQTMIVDTAGTDFTITKAGSAHIFNLPDASASNRGVVTTTDQVFAGKKTIFKIDSSENSVLNLVRLARDTSGTAQSGIGSSLTFAAKTSIAVSDIVKFDAILNDTFNSTKTSILNLSVLDNNSWETFKFDGSGMRGNSILLNPVTSADITVTTGRAIYFDSVSDVIKVKNTTGISSSLAGIASINSQLGDTQTITIESSGTSLAVDSGVNVHTIKIPAAGAGATSGLITNTAQTLYGDKEIVLSDALASSVTPLTLSHLSSNIGTGIGTGIVFKVSDDTSVSEHGRIDFTLTDTTHATRNSDFKIQTYINGSPIYSLTSTPEATEITRLILPLSTEPAVSTKPTIYSDSSGFPKHIYNGVSTDILTARKYAPHPPAEYTFLVQTGANFANDKEMLVVLSPTAGGIAVYDISQLPAQPTNTYSLGGFPAGCCPILAGNYLFYVKMSTNEIEVYNLEDIGSPSLIGQITTGIAATKLVIQGKHLFAADFTANKIRIFDISTLPSLPSGYSEMSLTSLDDFTIDQNYIYTIDTLTDNLTVYDIFTRVMITSFACTGNVKFIQNTTKKIYIATTTNLHILSKKKLPTSIAVLENIVLSVYSIGTPTNLMSTEQLTFLGAADKFYVFNGYSDQIEKEACCSNELIIDSIFGYLITYLTSGNTVSFYNETFGVELNTAKINCGQLDNVVIGEESLARGNFSKLYTKEIDLPSVPPDYIDPPKSGIYRLFLNSDDNNNMYAKNRNGVASIVGNDGVHANLLGLQGGASSEFYHLDLQDYTDISGNTQLAELTVSGSPTHANIIATSDSGVQLVAKRNVTSDIISTVLEVKSEKDSSMGNGLGAEVLWKAKDTVIDLSLASITAKRTSANSEGEFEIKSLVSGSMSSVVRCNSTATTFNAGKISVPTIFKGVTDDNLLKLDVANDRVCIGTSTSIDTLTVNGNISVSGTVDGIDVSEILNAPTITGPVLINGDLNIDGNLNTVTSTELKVEDRHITLNIGETGNGVTGVDSGIIIDRGTLDNYQFLFYEDSDLLKSGTVSAMNTLAHRDDTLADGIIPAWNNSTGKFTTGLTSAEATQLKNLDTTTVSTVQWGFLGALDQGLTTSSSPTFVNLTITNINGVNYTTQVGNTNSHISSTANPHTVTASQVNLGNVTNESKATMFTNPTFTGTTNVSGPINFSVNAFNVARDIILLNSGEATGGISSGFAGIELDRGTSDNARIGYNETLDLFTCGIIGDLSVIATRADSVDDGAVPVWDALNGVFETASGLTSSIVTQLRNIGVLGISGIQWGYFSALNQGISTTSNVTFNNLTTTTGFINNIDLAAFKSTTESHTANTSNPHSVTAAQVGLGNVTNESKTTMFTNPTFTGSLEVENLTHTGGVSYNITNVSAVTYLVAADVHVLMCDTEFNNIVVQLPNITISEGRELIIVKKHTNNTLTVDTFVAGQKIDNSGTESVVLYDTYDRLRLTAVNDTYWVTG